MLNFTLYNTACLILCRLMYPDLCITMHIFNNHMTHDKTLINFFQILTAPSSVWHHLQIVLEMTGSANKIPQPGTPSSGGTSSTLYHPLLNNAIPNLGQVVWPPSLLWRFYSSNVYHLIHSSFAEFVLHRQYLLVLPLDGVVWAVRMYVFWYLWCGGARAPMFSKSGLQWTFSFPNISGFTSLTANFVHWAHNFVLQHWIFPLN